MKMLLFRKLRAFTRAMRKGTQWRLANKNTALRHGTQCPLTFVAGLPGASLKSALKAAKALDLGVWDIEILRSSDGAIQGMHDRERLRRILLRAAGLSQSAKKEKP